MAAALRIELPLALPVIVAGIRITVVTQVAVATVAAYINAGGLGDIIFQGIAQDFGEKVVAGAVVTSALAISATRPCAGSRPDCARIRRSRPDVRMDLSQPKDLRRGPPNISG